MSLCRLHLLPVLALAAMTALAESGLHGYLNTSPVSTKESENAQQGASPAQVPSETEMRFVKDAGNADESRWTPMLLQLAVPEDYGSPPEPLPNVYGLGFGVLAVAANDVVGAELALGVPFAQNEVRGVQTGFIGAAAERINGIQVGGLMSAAKRLDGATLAGLFADAETGHGIVGSFGFTDTGNAVALANASLKPFTGIQLAGLANFGSDVTGVQIAIGYNFAGELHGVQIGLFNRALRGCGVQIGLWNLFGRGDDTIGLPLLNAHF